MKRGSEIRILCRIAFSRGVAISYFISKLYTVVF